MHNTVLPESDEAFDAYIVGEGFHAINRVQVMEHFLLRAARRVHVLDAEKFAATMADESLGEVKEKAWRFLYEQFATPSSDLRMFFIETADFYDQSLEERRRLVTLADALVGSAKDASQLTQAEQTVAAHAGRMSANTLACAP